jgi:phosphatidate cytidylyltransferase
MISENLKKRSFTSLILLILIFFIFNSKLILVYSLIVLGTLSILEFANMSNKIFNKKLYSIISNILFITFTFSFCLMFYFFASELHFKIILFSFLLGCIASDIGGYIFGKTLKGPKLTKISPKKTISGAFGSLIFTCLMISVLTIFFTKNFSYHILIVSIIISLGCQVGDLFFSFLKRKANLKDTGNFLPGHGGVLDRLDSVFLGIPVGLISLTLIY